MSMRVVKKMLLVEDNPGDMRLLREMINEDGSLEIDLACATSMAEAERHLALPGFTSFFSIWACPTRRDWLQFGEPGSRRRTFRWSF